MKNKILKITTLLLLLFAVFSVKVYSPSALQCSVYATTANLNFRTGPGVNYGINQVLPKGTNVNVIEFSPSWSKIEFNGKIGYVSSRYISLVESAEVKTDVVKTNRSNNHAMELEIFNEVNKFRVDNGLTPYVWDDTLYPVADIRAKESYTCWSHLRPDGRYVKTAFDECGVKYKIGGENLCSWFSDAKNCVYLWSVSTAGHKEAMLATHFSRCAVYVYTGPDGLYYAALEMAD